MGDIDRLNRMTPGSMYAELGTKMNQIITLLNELKSVYNSHNHGASAGNPPNTTASSSDVDVLK